MKTHSGSLLLDAADRLSLLLGAWGSLLGVALAFKAAENGDAWFFALWGGVAVLFGWVYAIDASGQLDHAARIAVLRKRIDELRAENDRHGAVAGGTP